MLDDRDDDQPRRERPTSFTEILQGKPASGVSEILQGKHPENDQGEASCKAFGYLRGIRDQATSIEFRLRDGNSRFFPYGWLGDWQFNPSEGLLLKFTGDVVYLILIKGSSLDRPLNDGAINLTRGGLQRHRVLWLREMTEDECRQIGETGPTIDSIEVAEFESHEAMKQWLGKNAPAFLRS